MIASNSYCENAVPYFLDGHSEIIMVEVTQQQQRLIDILEYWHKIEFFIPFDLDQVTDVEEVWRLRLIKTSQLKNWPDGYLQQFDVPSNLKITGFRLYLGLFDRSEIADVTRQLFPEMGNEDEDEQRGGMEGRTCFARIELTARGEPQFAPLSVSTVPWASRAAKFCPRTCSSAKARCACPRACC